MLGIILTLVLALIHTLFPNSVPAVGTDLDKWFDSAPSMNVGHRLSDDDEWALYHGDAVAEYADEFTALFNSYEVKRAKNGALMIRSGNAGSFRFAKKG